MPTVRASTACLATSVSNRVRVAVLGARGKVGTEICGAVRTAPDLELVAEIGRGDPLTALVAAGAEVAVDFTEPGSVADHVSFLIEHGIHAVIGTTGFDDGLVGLIQEQLGSAPNVGVLIAPNFALGAVLAIRFAEQAARFFESVEFIELHHPHKKDAPSGTAMHTAERIASARSLAGVGPSPDCTDRGIAGSRGASVGDVRVHAIRLAGLLSHQEVLLGNAGEVLTIRHDSLDRSSFVPGVLLAVRSIRSFPGLTFGLEKFLAL